ETLDGLQAADEVAIWHKHDQGPQSELIWAPEIHRVHGAWYIYYAAAPNAHGTADAPSTNETFNHRVFVLENTAADPFTGEWAERGQVDTGWESFALDATSFVHGDRQYLVWAQEDLEVEGHSNLYIAPMENPWTLAGPAVELTRPEHDWELKGFWVNEGPAVLEHRSEERRVGDVTGVQTCALPIFALDATSFVHGDRQYLVWAQEDLEVEGHSNLYIAPMENPWTLAGPAVELTRPEHDWEIKGFWVNEGPAVLEHEGTLYLTYSGAATGIDYAMGVLTASADADLLDPASWTKSPTPVFVSDPSVQRY